MAFLELESLTKTFGTHAAVDGLSLGVEKGEFVSLLGPSGYGKTTTLQMIAGFVEPTAGAIRMEGRDLLAVKPARRGLGIVFQSYALFPHMTVAENVGFGPRMAGEVPRAVAERVRSALALVSLAGMEGRRPSQLSGGQQQRVAVARALVNQPSVLLLDEPLGALDLKLRKQMQLELSRIHREVGITFVYVTHDQEEAMTMSDRIAVMNRGAIAQIGTPQEIYERPASLFVADFIGSSNILPGRVKEVRGPWMTVRLDEGALVRVPSAAGAPAGEPVSVVVRPDHMTILADPAEGRDMNRLVGRVTKVSFLGTHLQVSIIVGGPTALTVTTPLAEAERQGPPGVGSEISIAWAPQRSL